MNENTNVKTVREGGTGLPNIPPDTILVGTGQNTLAILTFQELLEVLGAAKESHTHRAEDVTSGVFSINQGGTGLSSLKGFDQRFYLRVNASGTGFELAQISSRIGSGVGAEPELTVEDLTATRLTGDRLVLVQAFRAVPWNEGVRITHSLPVERQQIVPSFSPLYSAGATQKVTLVEDMTVMGPSGMPLGGTMNLRFELNGYNLTFEDTVYEGPILSVSGNEAAAVAASLIHFDEEKIFAAVAPFTST